MEGSRAEVAPITYEILFVKLSAGYHLLPKLSVRAGTCGWSPSFKPLHLMYFVDLGTAQSFNLYGGAFGLADQRASER